tara:strand:- start:25 stop:1452 length:1428 start_codon:yes stop_codon:yes gene_type:complete
MYQGGSERMRIDSSGNLLVGGTTFDTGNFSNSCNGINVFDATHPLVNLVETTGGTSFFMAKTTSSCYIGTADAHFIGFSTSDAERMRIDSSGNLGIGTQSNRDSTKLDVLGDITFGPHASYYATLGYDAGAGYLNMTSSDGGFRFYKRSGPTERMRIDPSGRLLLGTTTEGQSEADEFTLSNSGHVGMTIRSTDSTSSRIYFSDATSGTGEYAGYFFYDHSVNSLVFGTNSLERMRITSSGYIEATGASQVRLTLGSEGTAGTNNANWIRGNGTSLGFNSASGGYQWEISGTERMRLDSSGNLLIGTTSTSAIDTPGFRFIQGAAGYSEFSRTADDGTANVYLSRGNNGRVLAFYRVDGGNTQVGTITVTSSATSYNTSSDYRLKENVDYTWDATTRIKQLKPARFNFIGDADTIVDGFLAHEVSSIVPEAITGTKDAVKADGKPEYQGIDQSKLVPLLVKTIQELEARITALEG